MASQSARENSVHCWVAVTPFAEKENAVLNAWVSSGAKHSFLKLNPAQFTQYTLCLCFTEDLMEKEEMAKKVEKKKNWRHWYLLPQRSSSSCLEIRSSQTHNGTPADCKNNRCMKQRKGLEHKEIENSLGEIRSEDERYQDIKGERISAAAVVWISHWLIFSWDCLFYFCLHIWLGANIQDSYIITPVNKCEYNHVCTIVKNTHNASQQIAHAVITILHNDTQIPANQQDCCDASDWRFALWVGHGCGGGVSNTHQHKPAHFCCTWCCWSVCWYIIFYGYFLLVFWWILWILFVIAYLLIMMNKQ